MLINTFIKNVIIIFFTYQLSTPESFFSISFSSFSNKPGILSVIWWCVSRFLFLFLYSLFRLFDTVIPFDFLLPFIENT